MGLTSTLADSSRNENQTKYIYFFNYINIFRLTYLFMG